MPGGTSLSSINLSHFSLVFRMIRLPGDGFAASDNAFHRALDTLASVPYFLVGMARIGFEWVSSRFNRSGLRARTGYRNIPVDEDAQVLRFEDEE